jgi:hypothetical protein
MDTWAAQFTGALDDLRLIAASPPDAVSRLVEEADGFWLESSWFAECSEASVVRGRAMQIAATLTAYSRLRWDSDARIEVGAVRRESGGQRHVYVFPEPAVARARVGPVGISVVHADGSVTEHRPGDQSRDWVAATIRNPLIAKILRLRARESLDWDDLSRILEVAQRVHGSIGKPEPSLLLIMKRVFGTANSVDALGDDARHGVQRTRGLNDPLGFDEARDAVDRVIRDILVRTG